MSKGQIVLLERHSKLKRSQWIFFACGAILRSGNVSGKVALRLLAMTSNITKFFPKTVPYIAELNTSPIKSLCILMAITSVTSAEFENDNSFLFLSFHCRRFRRLQVYGSKRMRERIVYPPTFRESRLRHLLGAYSTLSSSSHDCLTSCELSLLLLFIWRKFILSSALTQGRIPNQHDAKARWLHRVRACGTRRRRSNKLVR